MKWVLAFAVVALLAAPRAAVGHEGHDHKVMGTVTMVHENHLEVKDAKGKTTSVTVGPTTKIRRAKTVTNLASIKVGDRVVVTTRETKGKDGKVVVSVLSVEIGTPVKTTTS